MPRPDSLPHTTHYQMSDYRHQHSTERAAADQLALQVWADAWDDATTPRTDRPARFFALAYQRGTGVETRSFVTNTPDLIPWSIA